MTAIEFDFVFDFEIVTDFEVDIMIWIRKCQDECTLPVLILAHNP